jgi:hypothetical protein
MGVVSSRNCIPMSAEIRASALRESRSYIDSIDAIACPTILKFSFWALYYDGLNIDLTWAEIEQE